MSAQQNQEAHVTQPFLRIIYCMKFQDFCKLLNQPEDSNYAEEKFQVLRKNLGLFLMELDEKNFEKFAVWASEEKYRQDCRKVSLGPRTIA